MTSQSNHNRDYNEYDSFAENRAKLKMQYSFQGHGNEFIVVP